MGRDIDGEVVGVRYEWIDYNVLRFVVRIELFCFWTDCVDGVLLYSVWGFLFFIILMVLVFQVLFVWSDLVIGLIEIGMGMLGDGVRTVLLVGMISDFVSDGFIGGVGNVLVFLFQILLLFVFIGFMEDSGYMVCVVFLMDRIMNWVGFHGWVFVFMLSVYVCVVLVIMVICIMECQRDRFLTMMVLPLIICLVRLLVYTLIIGVIIFVIFVFVIFDTQSLVMIVMYFFGLAMVLVVVVVLGCMVLKGFWVFFFFGAVGLLVTGSLYHRAVGEVLRDGFHLRSGYGYSGMYYGFVGFFVFSQSGDRWC